jgi:3-oxoacyl-[acyl-carrier protein] reductase
MGETRNFFLTGCASGIGRHLSGLIVDRGYNLFATDVDVGVLEAVAEKAGWPGDRVATCALDVRDPDGWESVFAEAVDRFGHIDVCMNIAGVLLANWVHETPRAEVDAQIDVNLKGVIYGTQTAARHMVGRGEGHIVNIASIAGVAAPSGLSVYTASKHGVRGFSIASALELRNSGVFVTALCPDAVNTPMANIPKDNDAGALYYSGSRLLTPDEIGATVMNKVLAKKPITLMVPRGRGMLAHISNLFPALTFPLFDKFMKKGRKAHQRHEHVDNG